MVAIGLVFVGFIKVDLATAEAAPLAPLYRVVGITYEGLERTDPGWLSEYINYRWPLQMTEEDARSLETRLLTTAVFSSVKARFQKVAPDSSDYTLNLEVEEKWTTIPVARAAYGGGTPLTVIGAYDTHSFGRLLTLGGEMRRYGAAPPGFVIFAKDPMRDSGRFYLGSELWRDFRRRDLYDRRGEIFGHLNTNATTARLIFLSPLLPESLQSKSTPLRGGGEMEWSQEGPSHLAVQDDAAVVPGDFSIGSEVTRSFSILPSVQFDTITVENMLSDGFRFAAKWGPTLSKGAIHRRGEIETFFYKRLPYSLNLAMHGFAGQSSIDALQNQYFLGGFDSIRGLPDGAIYGTRAYYYNAELRHISFKSRYIWLQSIAFYDAGGAAPDWSKAWQDQRGAVGAGIRIAVPKVHRMVFRLDYAWSVDGAGTRGISAGMNQFFDPYKPLSR